MSETLLNVETPEGLFDAMVNHGVSPAMLHGITPEQLEAVYSLCYEDLMAERFEEGLERALFLVRKEPWDRRFHMAFAYALHQLGQYDSAGRSYTVAFEMDPSDPVCALRLGECLGAMEDVKGAREMFDAAIKLSWLDVSYEDVRQQAERYLDQLARTGS
jgi:Flp pilus assembly protein TadD